MCCVLLNFSVDCHQPVNQPAFDELLFEHALALPSLLPSMHCINTAAHCCAIEFLPYLQMQWLFLATLFEQHLHVQEITHGQLE